ncbi:MAG: spore maturation protein A [Oscillospiraceae bacterium]|nr:spore maturation protein A [Oscillospiraceae bacterium]
MILGWIWTLIVFLSILFSVFTGKINEVSAATAHGAQAGVTAAIGIAGSICLWSGVGNLMDKTGLTGLLAKLLRPLLNLLFPGTKKDPQLRKDLSANICANILGLGNAATPMGIKAVKGMRLPHRPHMATDEMCRLIVLNTASIQLIPANVAAVRASLGCAAPFDILPAVWLTSITSATVGLTAAWCMGKLCRNG